MRNAVLLGVALVCALGLGPAAGAGPYIESASRTRVHAGDVVRLRAGAGLRLYALLPLYLVPARSAPRPYPCTVRGQVGSCEPAVPRPPRGAAFHRIGTLNTRHSKEVTILFRVPRLRPGPYVYVLYCGPCHRGPDGSLIAWLPRPTLTVTG